MKTVCKPKTASRPTKTGSSVSTSIPAAPLPRLVKWLQWLGEAGKGGPSPSQAAKLLGCTPPMVNQLVRRGILERSVYEEDGFSIVIVSQRSIDAARESKKKWGCWTQPRAFVWRSFPPPRSLGKDRKYVGAVLRQVPTPWLKRLRAVKPPKRKEFAMSVEQKLAFLNKMSPLKDHYTSETKVECLHCGRVYRAYEAKLVEARRVDVAEGMRPPPVWINCKFWPMCDGTVIDWVPPGSLADSSGKPSKGRKRETDE